MRLLLSAALTIAASGGALPPSQLLLGYYSGVGLDTAGSVGLNGLALAFFDPSAMAQPSVACDFSGDTPCLTPAPGGGPSLSMSWINTTVTAAIPALSAAAAPGAPLFLVSFGGATCGGGPWDTIFGSAASAKAFGANAAALVTALASAYPAASFGIDMDIEATSTLLPYAADAVAAYRAGAPYALHPLQLCALSGLAERSSTDFFKLALLNESGPVQQGISHLNLMVDNEDEPCAAYAQWWNASALAFLPLSSRVGGCWGEIYPSFILHPPGCVDGEAPLFPWMKEGRVGLAIWELWAGPVDGITAVVAAIKA